MPYDKEVRVPIYPVIVGTLVGARDAGVRDPDTGSRLRIIEVICREDDVIDLDYHATLLMQPQAAEPA